MNKHNILPAMAFLVAAATFATPAGAANAPKWMSIDHASKTVSLGIDMGSPKVQGGFNFEGYAQGHMTITVPVGWKVKIKADNIGNLTHSLEIVPAQKKAPVQAIQPAFAHAEIQDVSNGIAPNKSGSIQFVANKVGEYWMICGVPGHALGGMWDHFVVSQSAWSPSVSFAK